jgi:hypothetical protein
MVPEIGDIRALRFLPPNEVILVEPCLHSSSFEERRVFLNQFRIWAGVGYENQAIHRILDFFFPAGVRGPVIFS